MDLLRDHVVKNAKDLRRRGLVKSQLGKSFDPLSIPTVKDPRDNKIDLEDENGCLIVDTSKRPFFNPEIMIKKNGKSDVTILTKFFEMEEVDDHGGRIPVDPMELVNTETDKKRFDFHGAVEYDHVFVNSAAIIAKVRVPDGYVLRYTERATASDLPPSLAQKMSGSVEKKRGREHDGEETVAKAQRCENDETVRNGETGREEEEEDDSNDAGSIKDEPVASVTNRSPPEDAKNAPPECKTDGDSTAPASLAVASPPATLPPAVASPPATLPPATLPPASPASLADIGGGSAVKPKILTKPRTKAK